MSYRRFLPKEYEEPWMARARKKGHRGIVREFRKSRIEYANRCRALSPNSDGSKKIILTQGKFAVVSPQDFEKVIRFKWCFNGRYACTNRNLEEGGSKTLYMHEFLFEGVRPMDFRPHHIDENKLNNRRSNLVLLHKDTHMQVHRSKKEVIFRFPRFSDKEKFL